MRLEFDAEEACKEKKNETRRADKVRKAERLEEEREAQDTPKPVD